MQDGSSLFVFSSHRGDRHVDPAYSYFTSSPSIVICSQINLFDTTVRGRWLADLLLIPFSLVQCVQRSQPCFLQCFSQTISGLRMVSALHRRKASRCRTSYVSRLAPKLTYSPLILTELPRSAGNCSRAQSRHRHLHRTNTVFIFASDIEHNYRTANNDLRTSHSHRPVSATSSTATIPPLIRSDSGAGNRHRRPRRARRIHRT